MSKELTAEQRRVLRAVRLNERLDPIDDWQAALQALIALDLIEMQRVAGTEIPICTAEGLRIARRFG